jgi:hypothetical protein
MANDVQFSSPDLNGSNNGFIAVGFIIQMEKSAAFTTKRLELHQSFSANTLISNFVLTHIKHQHHNLTHYMKVK